MLRTCGTEAAGASSLAHRSRDRRRPGAPAPCAPHAVSTFERVAGRVPNERMAGSYLMTVLSGDITPLKYGTTGSRYVRASTGDVRAA